MYFKLLNPSRFIDETDFLEQKERTLTITALQIEELENTAGKKERKGMVSFAETPKALVINVTNANCLKAMFGPETNAWIGKRVVLIREEWFNTFEQRQSSVTRIKGSPDITAAVAVVTKLRGKKTDSRTMQPLGKKAKEATTAVPPLTCLRFGPSKGASIVEQTTEVLEAALVIADNALKNAKGTEGWIKSVTEGIDAVQEALDVRKGAS